MHSHSFQDEELKLHVNVDDTRDHFVPIVKFQMSSKRKSLALRVTSINLVSLERGRKVDYVFQCFQLGKLDLGVT